MIYFRFIFIPLIFLMLPLKANEVEIIELHKNKSLDQLVLESENNIEEKKESKNIEILDENSLQDESLQSNNKSDEINIKDSNNNIVTVLKTEKILDIDENIIEKYFSSIGNVKSKTLHREFLNILSNPELVDQKNNSKKIYFIVKKLYELGEIGKAYNLVKNVDINNISDQEHLNYFYLIELNYLFSTFKLSEVCELKSLLLDNSAKLSNFLLEKTDIFCLTLENNLAEAKLLNSLLLDTEKELDQNFQKLFNYMILTNESDKLKFESLTEFKLKELIFLYTAMLRINELQLHEDFIEIDPLNLSIPVILSNSTNMDIRIKAANKAFYDEVITIDSLSALYQSVDFNSKQFSEPEKTILSLGDNKDLIMAFYYQFANIQIFPDQRLSVILDYWEFAKNSELEKIAYAITQNIFDNFKPSSSNTEFGIKIALAHISNKNYNEALRWINFYENSNAKDSETEYAKFLINLHKNNDLDTIINYLTLNYSDISNLQDQKIVETFEVLMKFLNIQQISKFEFSYNTLLDERLMPTYFILKDINKNIEEKNDLSFFILSLITINNKKWSELHPEHLNIALKAFSIYDQGSLIKSIILEILNELEIFNE
jgi:hypothetical protein